MPFMGKVWCLGLRGAKPPPARNYACDTIGSLQSLKRTVTLVDLLLFLNVFSLNKVAFLLI